MRRTFIGPYRSTCRRCREDSIVRLMRDHTPRGIAARLDPARCKCGGEWDVIIESPDDEESADPSARRPS